MIAILIGAGTTRSHSRLLVECCGAAIASEYATRAA